MRRVLLGVVFGAYAAFGPLACQHTKPVVETKAGKTAPATVAAAPSELLKYSGDISAIHSSDNIVTVKVLLSAKDFKVAADCEIVTADRPRAALEDLEIGQAVDVLYEKQAGATVAHRIAVKGVTPAEKEADREKEHLEKLLTSNPSERPPQ